MQTPTTRGKTSSLSIAVLGALSFLAGCRQPRMLANGSGAADGSMLDGRSPDADGSDRDGSNGSAATTPADAHLDGDPTDRQQPSSSADSARPDSDDPGIGLSDGAAACASDDQCSTGHCVDEVCCDQACGGQCMSCSKVFTGGTDGVCAPVKDGANPHASRDCRPSDGDTCGNDGTCDGSGGCRLQGTSQTCSSAACSGASGAQSFQSASTCDGHGKCVSPAAQSCGQFDCSPTNGCATPCASDGSCSGGNYCAADSICRTKKIDGSACTTASECIHGFCADGICCDTDCSKKVCFSCSRNNTGQPDGRCAPVARGNAPSRAAECPAADAATCGLDGTCDGDGACKRFGNATACADATCSGTTFTATATCDGSGSCRPGAKTECGQFQCTASGCRKSCQQDGDCTGGSFCGSDGACAAKGVNGTSCKANKECSSGACTDGVCCDSSCGQTCYGCSLDKTGKANGVCAPLKAGTSRSASECPAASMSSCGNDGSCDGSGKCRAWASGTTCASGSCSSAGYAGAKVCDGAGHCKGPAVVSCGSYPCDASKGCAASCTSTQPCLGDTYCDAGSSKCVAKKNNGQPCSSEKECLNNICADGVCCNAPCTETCNACNISGSKGTCSRVSSGSPAPGHGSCNTDGSACGGSCTGNSSSCSFPSSSQTCGSAKSCSSDLGTLNVSTCNGAGACVAANQNCASAGKYCNKDSASCAAKQSSGGCSNPAQCASGNCTGSLCCNAGLTGCGSSCVNTSNDPQNCGQCSKACPAGATCASGGCACNASAVKVAVSTSDQTVCSGQTPNPTISVTATGGSGTGFKYQWYKMGQSAALANGPQYGGTTTSTLSFPNVQATAGTDRYYCVVTDVGCAGSATSATSSLTVNPSPTITSIKDVTLMYAPAECTPFDVTVSGGAGGYEFSWYRGNTFYDHGSSGSPSTNTMITACSCGDSGTYHCVVTDAKNCTARTNDAKVTFTGCP